MQKKYIILFICIIIIIFIYLCIIYKTHDTYEEIPNYITLDELQTGDLVLFNDATDNFFATSLQIVGQTVFYHIGIIIKIENEVYIWESMTGKTRNFSNGAQLTPIYKYKNLVIRQLYKNNKKYEIPMQNIVPYILNQYGRPYSFAQFNLLIKSAWLPFLHSYDYLSKFKKLKKKAMCSQLIAETYEYCDVIDLHNYSKKSYEFIPPDFAQNNLPMKNNFSFGPCLTINI